MLFRYEKTVKKGQAEKRTVIVRAEITNTVKENKNPIGKGGRIDQNHHKYKRTWKGSIPTLLEKGC